MDNFFEWLFRTDVDTWKFNGVFDIRRPLLYVVTLAAVIFNKVTWSKADFLNQMKKSAEKH